MAAITVARKAREVAWHIHVRHQPLLPLTGLTPPSVNPLLVGRKGMPG